MNSAVRTMMATSLMRRVGMERTSVRDALPAIAGASVATA